MAEQRENSTRLGTTEQAGVGSRGGFSRQADDIRPSLNRSFKRSSDTLSPALEMGAAIAADTYVGVQSNKIDQQINEVQDVAYRDATGQMSVQEMQRLERSNAMFKKYVAARRQGAMTDAAANIAIEAEIKQVANQFPALAPQVRRAAATTLGFDPTGSEYAFLTDPNMGKQRSETGIEKAQREASYVEQQLGMEPGSLQKSVLQNYRRAQELATLEYQEKMGAMASGDVVNKYNATRDMYFGNLTGQLYKDLNAAGEGIQNISPARIKSLQAKSITMMNQKSAELRAQLSNQMGMTTSEVNAAVNDYRSNWEKSIESLGNLTSQDFMDATIKQRNTTMTMMAQGMLPLAFFGKSLGYEGQDNMMFMDAFSNPDGPWASRMIQSSPMLRKLAAQGNVGEELQSILQGVMSGDVTSMQSAGLDPNVGAKTTGQYILDVPEASNIGGGKAGQDVMSTLRSMGNEAFVIDQIAENPAQYANNRGVVRGIQDSVGEINLSMLAQQVADRFGSDFQFRLEGGQLIEDNDMTAFERSNMIATSPDNNAANSLLGKYVKILQNPAMAQRVGMSPQQLTAKVNSLISNPSKRVSARDTSANARNRTMVPVSTREVTDAAVSAGVDPTMFSNLIRQESAMGSSNPVSSAGAAGVAQFMPDTAQDMGLRVDDQVDERYDNGKALVAAAKYYKQQTERFDDDVLGLMAYNWGPGNVEDFISKERNSIDGVPKETQDYVLRISGMDLETYLRERGFINTY